MLLNNYYNYMYFIATRSTGEKSANPDYSGSQNGKVYGVVLKDSDRSSSSSDTSGTLWMQFYNYSNNSYQYIRQNASPYYSIGLDIGTGNSEVDPTQYQLDNRVNLSNVSRTSTYLQDSENHKFKIKLTYSGVNSTENPIIIKEAGIYKNTYHQADYPYSGIGSGTYAVYFSRILLDTPITIQPNERATICVDWDIY